MVVGGGIAGLCAAFFLIRQGDPPVQVTLLESSQLFGGKLRAGVVAGLPVDVGAESLLLRRPEGKALLMDVGLADELVTAATTSAAIWSRGHLRPIPSATVLGVPADVSALAATGLLNVRELARVPLDFWLPRTRFDGDISVGHYVGARVGRAVVDRLVEPLLGGVYAGHADLLSLEATLPRLAEHARGERSLLAAAAAARSGSGQEAPLFGSLRGGLSRLADAVATAAADHGVTLHKGVTVRDVRRTPNGWQVSVGPTRAPQLVAADAVILATPPHVSAKLLAGVVPGAAADLAQIPSASTAIVTLAFHADAAAALRRGSGFLVPPVDGRLIKAATFTTTKWSWYDKSSPGTAIVRASIGRHNEEIDLQRDDEDLVEGAHADLAEALGLDATPIDAAVTRWGGALPQYHVGHRARVERVRTAVAAAGGLALCGAAFDGVGIPACIATAERAATEVLGQWAHV